MPGFANRKITIRRERFYAHSIVGDYAPRDAGLGFYAPHAADYEVITWSDLVDHADSLGREAGFAETVASMLRKVGTVSGPWGAGNWFIDPSGPTQVGPCEVPDCGCEGEFQRTDAFLYRFAPAQIRSIAAALAEHERRMRGELS